MSVNTTVVVLGTFKVSRIRQSALERSPPSCASPHALSGGIVHRVR
jgi:hypothetical protein